MKVLLLLVILFSVGWGDDPFKYDITTTPSNITANDADLIQCGYLIILPIITKLVL